MRRFSVANRRDGKLKELHPKDVLSLIRHDEINGERSLEIEVAQSFDVGSRIIYQDDSEKWHEYVIYGLEQQYKYRSKDVYKYYCVWSIQHDLQGTVVSSMPGVQNPVSASAALDAALAGTHRWTRGTVDVTATAGASMYMMQGWDAIGVLLENWGGELDSTIEVSSRRVESRKADLYQHIGSTVAKHRYDLGFDVKSIKRIQEDGPLVCRIIPLGKGEQTGDGYGRKITIESVNNNRNYLTYTPMQSASGLPYRIDSSTVGTEYPTIIVENSSCETPADLKAWAEANIASFCTPKVTYVVDVVAATAEGLDIGSLSLGDVVHVADEQLSTASSALRLEARVVAMDVDELTGKATSITIGSITDNLSTNIGGMSKQLSAISDKVDILADTGLTDTGWQTLNSAIKYRVKNGFCTVAGISSNAVQISSSGTTVGTLPEEARPSTTQEGAASIMTNTNGQWSIDANGVITVWTFGSSSTKYWAFSSTFPVG